MKQLKEIEHWIFLRGLSRTSVHWGPFYNLFREQFPKAHVELLDIRGNGSQSHIPSYTSIEENVRDLRGRSSF